VPRSSRILLKALHPDALAVARQLQQDFDFDGIKLVLPMTVLAGDVIFRECTPMGWNGSYEKWLKNLDLIISLDPEVIVPGHGPECGIEGPMEMKAYLEYVREESKRCVGQGLSAPDASKKIDFGPYGGWRGPARLYVNVERAYREFRNEAADARWDHGKTVDAIYAVAKAKGIEVEFGRAAVRDCPSCERS